MKSVILHVVSKYEDYFDKIQYSLIFSGIKSKFEQLTDKTRGMDLDEGEKSKR
jgi:hypothetical protein